MHNKFSILEGQEEDPYYFSDFYFDSNFDYNNRYDLIYPILINDKNKCVYNSEDVRYNYYNKHKDGFDLYKCYNDSNEYDNLNMINVRKNYGFKYKNLNIYQEKTPNSGNKDARCYLKSFNSQKKEQQ